MTSPIITRLQGAQRDVHVLAQRLAVLVELHDATPGVVLAVPDDLIAGCLVQDQSWWLDSPEGTLNGANTYYV